MLIGARFNVQAHIVELHFKSFMPKLNFQRHSCVSLAKTRTPDAVPLYLVLLLPPSFTALDK
jgi:hypothetical protein